MPDPESRFGVAPLRLAVRRRVRRLTRSPFDPVRGPALLVHGAHHKVGTVWFQRILSTVAGFYGLRFAEVPASYGIAPPAPGVGSDIDIVVFDRANDFRPEDALGRAYRGSHLIRDPRDVVVSGYHYHLRTDEAWVRVPKERWGGLSYQAFLQSVDEHDGVMAEIDRSARFSLADMGRWSYGRPEILELRYEDVVRDKGGDVHPAPPVLRPERRRRGAGDDHRQSVQPTPAARRRAPLDRHVRSGEPGEWRRYFGDDHVARFKELTGDLVVRLGYEADSGW